MGVYIKGMDMPKNCHECVFGKYEVCAINISVEKKDAITHSCPLVEVPPHGRLIDADTLKARLFPEKIDGIKTSISVSCMKLVIDDAPTVIEADADND